MHHPVELPPAAKPTVIEIAGEKLGVVFPSGTKYRFVAVKLPVFPIDGREFDSIAEARAAARAVVEHPESQSEPTRVSA